MCTSREHTLRFELDTEDCEMFTSVFLNQYRNIFHRMWVAVKYVLGYKCKHGHWDCVIIGKDDADRLIEMLEEYRSLT